MKEIQFGKIILAGFVIACVVSFILSAYKQNLFETLHPLNTFLIAFVSTSIVLGMIRWVYSIYRNGWFVIVTALFISSCSYSPANVQTLVSDDCGVTWELIPTGSRVPAGGVNPCFYRVTVPDYPMQGECVFKATFKDNVRATVEIDYDFSIVDASLFIQEAKYLGKVSTDSTSSAYELAENTVIDKRIKDICRNLFIDEDVVIFSPSDFEIKLVEPLNEVLEKRGVHINYISIVPVFDVQTSEAIDVATAIQIYESKNLRELGEDVIKARAGASKIDLK